MLCISLNTWVCPFFSNFMQVKKGHPTAKSLFKKKILKASRELLLWEPQGWEECGLLSRHGLCSFTDTSTPKRGSHLEKCLFSCCVQGSHLTRYCVLYSHQLAQKQWTALYCQWISRSSNQFWVLGSWQSCDSHFLEFEVVGLTVLARVLLEIYVVEATCLH